MGRRVGEDDTSDEVGSHKVKCRWGVCTTSTATPDIRSTSPIVVTTPKTGFDPEDFDKGDGGSINEQDNIDDIAGISSGVICLVLLCIMAYCCRYQSCSVKKTSSSSRPPIIRPRRDRSSSKSGLGSSKSGGDSTTKKNMAKPRDSSAGLALSESRTGLINHNMESSLQATYGNTSWGEKLPATGSKKLFTSTPKHREETRVEIEENTYEEFHTAGGTHTPRGAGVPAIESVKQKKILGLRSEVDRLNQVLIGKDRDIENLNGHMARSSIQYEVDNARKEESIRLLTEQLMMANNDKQLILEDLNAAKGQLNYYLSVGVPPPEPDDQPAVADQEAALYVNGGPNLYENMEVEPEKEKVATESLLETPTFSPLGPVQSGIGADLEVVQTGSGTGSGDDLEPVQTGSVTGSGGDLEREEINCETIRQLTSTLIGADQTLSIVQHEGTSGPRNSPANILDDSVDARESGDDVQLLAGTVSGEAGEPLDGEMVVAPRSSLSDTIRSYHESGRSFQIVVENGIATTISPLSPEAPKEESADEVGPAEEVVPRRSARVEAQQRRHQK